MGTEEESVIVYLGNREAIEVLEDPETGDKIRTALPGKRCTTVNLAPGISILEAANALTHPEGGVWQAHSDATGPAWVASTNPALAQLMAAHWGCELREPDPGHIASGDETEQG